MKKITGILLLLMIMTLTFAGCGEKANKSVENKKIVDAIYATDDEVTVKQKYVVSDKVTDVKVVTDLSDKYTLRSLTQKDREKFLSIYEAVINSEEGKTIDEMTTELCDGGLCFSVYNGKEELDGMGINGQYFIYENLYYYIPNDSFKEVENIWKNTCRRLNKGSIKKIDVAYQGDISCGTLNDKEADKVLEIYRQVISTEKPACKIAEARGNYSLIFYGSDDNVIDDFGLEGQFIYYCGEYYHIPNDIFTNLLKIIERWIQ